MGGAADTVRLFFALWPDGELRAKLTAWGKRAAGRGQATRPENIHLTLAFLGDTDVALLPELMAIAAAVRVDPFRLALDRVGYWKHNRILWCGASEDPPALAALVADLRAGLEAASMRYDTKPFATHVTLVRKAAGLSEAPAWTPLIWKVADFALIGAARIEDRVSYAVLQRFPAAAN